MTTNTTDIPGAVSNSVEDYLDNSDSLYSSISSDSDSSVNSLNSLANAGTDTANYSKAQTVQVRQTQSTATLEEQAKQGEPSKIKSVTKTNVFLMVMALLFLIIGFVWFIYSLIRNISIMRAMSWPQVDAYIIESYARPSNLYESINLTNPNEIVDTINNPGRYSVTTQYMYTLNNQIYYGNEIVYYGPTSFSSDQANAIVNQFPKGSIRKIHYNPNNLNNTFLYVDKPSWSATLLGFILFLASAIFIFWNMKTHGDKKTELQTLTSQKNKLVKKNDRLQQQISGTV